jgi:hypothetical protein
VNPRVHCSDLDDVANDEDGNTNGQTASTTKPIGSVCSREGTNECTNGHHGDHQRRDLSFELPFAIGILILTKAALEVREQQHTGNLTSVVSEEEAFSVVSKVRSTTISSLNVPPIDVTTPSMTASMPTSAPRSLIEVLPRPMIATTSTQLLLKIYREWEAFR